MTTEGELRPDDRFAVAINPLLPDLLRTSLALRRFGGWLGLTVAGLLAALTVAGFIGKYRSGNHNTADVVVVTIAVVVLGGLALLSARLALRPSPHAQLLDNKHAFVITPETLEFPAVGHESAQVWPLQRTRTSSTGGRHGRLVLSCPGFRTRQYASIHLKETPEEVQARIMAAQRALAADERVSDPNRK